jgi:integrase
MTRSTFRKQITSNELWEKVNLKNKKLIEQFLKEKDIRSSDLTIINYKSDLEIFFTWNLLYNDNIFFVDIKKLQFSEFFSFVTTELKWGSARFSRIRSVLSSLSIFIERYLDDEYPQYRNIILKAIENMPKNTVREKTILTEEQINYIFKCLKKDSEIQITCWLALAIGSGSRFAELLRFTTDIISENNVAFDGIFLEILKPIKSKGRTKTGKMLIKYIIKDIFWKHYEEWLPIRKSIMEKNHKEHNFIFIKSNGDPAQESTIRSWIGKIEKYLNVPFYPHALRHYFSTYLSKSNLPYDLIQEICGWTSTEMIKIYDDTSIKNKKFLELENLKKNLDSNKMVIL